MGMIAYKLFTLRKDGTIGPLFINKRQRIPLGKWVPAGNYPTKGYAVRPGWHVLPTQDAPHLSEKGRVWAQVEIGGDIEVHYRPPSQGGVWYLATKMKVIKLLESEA